MKKKVEHLYTSIPYKQNYNRWEIALIVQFIVFT